MENNSTPQTGVEASNAATTVTIVVAKALPQIPEKVLAQAAENLESAIMKIIHEGRFFSNLLLNFRREFTVKLPTLGVNVTDEVNLFINPYFFNSMTPIERVEVLKHECYHVINNHFVRFRDLEPQIFDVKERSFDDRKADQESASLLNQAADYAINEYLPLLPKDMKMFQPDGTMILQPDVMPDGTKNPDAGKPVSGKPLLVDDLKKKFPHINNDQMLEYYYEFLKQEQQKQKGNGKGQGQGKEAAGQGDPSQGMTIDDHSIWHESEATEDQITDKVKAVVNKALEATPDRERGSLPMEIQQAIAALNHIPKDWRQDVQRFVARTAEIIIDSSRKRRNRRYGILYPGIVTFPKLHIAIGIDSSGSVHDEELTQFFAEMVRIHNLEIQLTVIEADTKVNAVYKFNPKKPFLVSGRGGTSFKPVFEECEKADIDGLIYFTDGECYDEGIKKPRYPVLWAIVGGEHRHPPYKWGGRTRIEIKKKVHV